MGSAAGDVGSGALGGAASGAAIGSVAGPWGTAIGAGIGGIAGGIGGWLKHKSGPSDDDKRKAALAQQANYAGKFASLGERRYGELGDQGDYALRMLQKQAEGRSSVSQLQLAQALQQNQAQQAALAASAAPQNASMAARQAAMNNARLGYGLAGQQAVAGLQERNQAQQQYAALLQGLRGQDLNAALASRQNAMTGYGANAAGAPAKSWTETYGPAITAGLAAYGKSKGG
jgi:hypothetical protein